MLDKTSSAGFSFIEMLVVVAIISVLVSFVGWNYLRYFDRSAVEASARQIRSIINDARDKAKNGRFAVQELNPDCYPYNSPGCERNFCYVGELLTDQVALEDDPNNGVHCGGRARVGNDIGDNSGYVAESIQFYFDIIAENSFCEGAALNIERIKPMLKCKKCESLFERVPFSFSCTVHHCNGEGEPTDIGREFFIRSIEILKG